MSAKTQIYNPLRFGKDDTSPSIADVITIDDEETDLTGSTVTFQMRPLANSNLKINSAAVLENQLTNKGGVRYDPVTNDFDTAGEFFGRWRIVLPSSKIQTTPEFLIVVDEFSDGVGVLTGDIYQRVRGHLPNSLAALSKDPRFGDIRIQQKIDLVKYRLFATSVSPALEATSYNPMVLDFLAKKSTIEIIPAAVDFWTDNPQTLNTTGTDEVISYPDRIAALWKVYERIAAEIEKLEADVLADLVTTTRKRVPAAVDTRAEDMVTNDPIDMGRAFADPHIINSLPWRLIK